MNLYFWLFSLCAVLSVPLSVQLSLRVGRGVRYRICLQAMGLPVVKKKEDAMEERTVDAGAAAHGIWKLNKKMICDLFRDGHLIRAARVFHLQEIYIRSRLSFEDAALTSMSYAAVRTILQILLMCRHRPSALQGRVEMDFHQRGSEIFVRCILSARLGSLLAAALRLFAVILRMRARHLKTEEDTYAASH